MDQEKDDLVFYDGRLLPLSQALIYTQEDIARTSAQASKPHPTPVHEWDRQRLGLDERFAPFYAEVDARKQLLTLLQTIQKTKQAMEIAEQKAKQAAETARQEAEIARLAYWGIPGPLDLAHLSQEVFTFDRLFATPPDWFGRSYRKCFVTWLQENKYPEDLLTKQVIARVGYERLIAKAQENRRTRNLTAQHKTRNQPTPSTNPLPEPVERRSTDKSKASNEK